MCEAHHELARGSTKRARKSPVAAAAREADSSGKLESGVVQDTRTLLLSLKLTEEALANQAEWQKKAIDMLADTMGISKNLRNLRWRVKKRISETIDDEDVVPMFLRNQLN